MKLLAIFLCALAVGPLSACRTMPKTPVPTDPPDAALFPDKTAAYNSGFHDGFQTGILEGVMMVSGEGPNPL
jgi:hypothetical protein